MRKQKIKHFLTSASSGCWTGRALGHNSNHEVARMFHAGRSVRSSSRRLHMKQVISSSLKRWKLSTCRGFMSASAALSALGISTNLIPCCRIACLTKWYRMLSHLDGGEYPFLERTAMALSLSVWIGAGSLALALGKFTSSSSALGKLTS